MPVGSLVFGWGIPQNPPGSPLSDAEFKQLVRKRMNIHMDEWNLQPTRFNWVDSPDTPDSPTDASAYVLDCISETGIDVAQIDPNPIGEGNYCAQLTTLVCYSNFAPIWSGPANANPLVVTVPLGNGSAIEIALTCQLSFDEYGVFK